MPDLSIHQGDHVFKGSVSFTGELYPPAGAVGNADFSSAAADQLEATKAVHQFPVAYNQVGGTDVVTATKILHVAKGAGTLFAVDVRPETAPTGGDKKFTVDVKKAANGSTSFASILSAAEDVDSGSVNGTVQTVVPTTDDYSAGDCFEVVITASGSTGSQGQGVTVVLWFREEPY